MSKEQAADIVAASPSGPAYTGDSLEWSNYGAALYLLRRDDDAMFAVNRAVEIQRNSTTLLNLGVVLEGFGRFDAAQTCFEEARTLDPESLLAGSACADGRLRLGRWSEGWPLYAQYHSRLLIKHIPSLSDLRGKRILVVKNGKYGDNLYHLRWFGVLRAAGCHISYVCDPALIPLLQGHPWVDQLLPAPEGGGMLQWYVDGPPSHTVDGMFHFNLREFEYIVSVMSLPAILQAQIIDAWWGAYLLAPKPTWWHVTRRIFSRHPRVGICWKAGEADFPRAHRSLSESQLRRIIHANPKVKWISLVADEAPPPGVSVSRLSNWRDTASVVASCDFVVTVDTGVAHLAGAMDKPTLVMLSGGSAWQYGLGEDHRAIYPSMRTFRNRGIGIDNAVTSLVEALEDI